MGEVALGLEQRDGDREALELAAQLREASSGAGVEAEELTAERLPLGGERDLPV